ISSYDITIALGIEPAFGLGFRGEVLDFLKGPVVDTLPPFGLYYLHQVILYAAALVGAIRLVTRLLVPAVLGLAGRDRSHRADVGYPLARFSFWAYVVIPDLIELLTIEVYFYHYFYVTSLFVCVFVACVALPWRWLLAVLVAAQLA